MNDTVTIPDTRFFKMIELKKKGRLRTAKLSIQGEFDEVITKQRITMFYDFSHEEEVLEEAEKDLSAAKYDSKNQLLDTDDEGSMSNKVKKFGQRVENLKTRLASLKEQHKDFTFFGKAVESKLKVSDRGLVTETVYQIDKKTIDRFDEMSSHLPNYRMITVDHNERIASQKTGMLDTVAKEVSEGTKFTGFATEDSFVLVPEKDFGQPIQVAKNINEFDSSEIMEFAQKIIDKSTKKKDALAIKEIFEGLASIYKGRINELKIILQGRRDGLETLKQNDDDSILAIAIKEASDAGKGSENGLRMMITLAAGFDFIEILKQYE